MLRVGLFSRALVPLAALAACTMAEAEKQKADTAAGYHLIPGSFVPDKGPDGNSIFLEAPDGLILIDTGRHPDHRDKLLAYARQRGRPIAAIINTHWHLDHTTSNAEIRAAHPKAEIIASRAVDGEDFKSFMAKSRAGAEAYLASGKATPAQQAEMKRAFAVMDNLEPLRATRPVDRSGPMVIAGRPLKVNLARHAATEGDVWVVDPTTETVFAGDLVVDLVPFMDTACPEGWRKALDEVAATPFRTLVPGHGAPMDRPRFMTWRTAFNSLLDCAASSREKAECIAGWRRDAAPFIPAGDEKRVDGMVGYYIDSRLRASPEERTRYCAKA